MAARYRAGEIGYGETKELVADAHERRFAESRNVYFDLMDRQAELRKLLHDGAERARSECSELLANARNATGVLS